MAAAKIRVSDIAKRMGKSEKDVIFQLQSLGAEISDPNQALEPEVIQALITGKKLTTRSRSVIMREDKPQPEKAKKEAVRPPRPIVKPAPRTRVEAPKEEAPVAQAPPSVIIPEFVQAAEDEERAAKEAPPAAPGASSPAPRVMAGAPPAPEPARAPASTQRPPAAPPAMQQRRPAGPSGPRARAPQGARPNYAGQTPAVRPSLGTSTRPPMGARPAGPTGARPTGARPSGPGMRSAGPGLRPAGGSINRPPMPTMPSVLPGGATIRRKKATDEVGEESREKKKPAGKGVKKTREVEVDAELFTKGPF